MPRDEVDNIVQRLLGMPRVARQPAGTACLAYSDSGHDGRVCVFNIAASAAHFLELVRAAGFLRPGQRELVAALERRNTLAYRPATGFWPYLEGRAADQDWNHNAVNAEQAYFSNQAHGIASIRAMMAAPPPAGINPLAYVTLLPHQCSRSDTAARQVTVLRQRFRSYRFGGSTAENERRHAGLWAQLAAESAKAAGVCPR